MRVKKAIPEGVIVVVDALDECSDNVNVRSFLDALYQSAGDLPIRFFVTCRPDPSLSKKLQSWNEGSRILFHLHDIEQSVVRGDIEIYLSAELGGLATDHIRQLSEQAGKLFIFAATIVRYVKPDDDNDIWYDRLETMVGAQWSSSDEAYTSIDTLYSTILSAAFSRNRLGLADVETMKRAIHSVICAKEPMTIQTLAGVLGVSVDRLVRVVDPLRSVLHVSEGNQLVSTLHASFPDYMFNQERSKEFFCDMGTHHRLLTLRCFDVMNESLRFNICDLESSYMLDADVPNLSGRVDNAVPSHLFYACSHWGDHLSEVEAEEALVAPLHAFLSNSMLFWLEVLNLRKCIGVGITMLANVQKWLQGCTVRHAVCGITQDAYKFATLVGTCYNTPHIYVSVLALWRREDPMWICYGRRLEGLEQLERALHSSKTSALLALLATWERDHMICSIAVSLDGSRVVSNYENRFIVRDTYTGNQILSPATGHVDSVTSVAISPNGHTIASGSYYGTINIWNAETGDIIAGPLEGHTELVHSVAFSPDSACIASGSEDCTIRIWETQTGRMLLSPLEGHTDEVHSVAFSPDGGRVASGSRDHTICIWDVQTGHMLMGPLEGHTDGVWSVGFSPNGARIASSSSDCTVRIWDAQNGNMLSSLVHGRSGVWSVAFSLDGTRVVSGSADGTICIWDVYSGDRFAGPFQAHTDAILSVVLSPDGHRLISSSDDHTIRIWDVNTTSLCVDQFDLVPPSVVSAAFSLDNSRIISGFSSGAVQIWNMRTGDLLADLLMPGSDVPSRAFSPDGARAGLGFDKGNIEIWDVEYGTMLPGPLRGHTKAVLSLTFSPSGNRLASGSDDGTILLWDVHTGNVLTDPLKGHTGVVHSVAFSPDGARIASGSEDHTVCIWDAQTGDVLLGPLKGHSRTVCSVGFSPDGRHLVSGSWDRAICLWDVQTGSMLADPFEEHTAAVTSVAFSPDGRRIVSGSYDRTIRIWDAQTGQTLAGPFEAHTEGILSVAFSPDGNRVVSGSDDGRIFVWELGDSDYDARNIAGAWSLDREGWIVGRDSARLLWLPPALRMPPPGEPIVIHNRGPFGIDFDAAPVGTRWATCFSG
ncbi:hypothetical protein FS749_004281 [Ceratobasidium sp. UAMH 11750]|nr:hypothetical protein FS749_004281 [Ceratobasidium sp. UAMH 11750]